MMDWSLTKRRMKASVHATMGVPAVYLTHASGSPIRVRVRDHTKTPVPMEVSGVDGSPASRPGEAPHIIFAQSEIARPAPGAIVIFSVDRAVRLGRSDPADDGFVRVDGTPMNPSQTASFLASLESLIGPEWEGIL